MTAATLRALAARCMEAGAGDRELDAEIANAIGISGNIIVGHGGWCLGGPSEKPFLSPAFTADLNAAMSLVPGGWGGNINFSENRRHHISKLARSHPTNRDVIAEAPTPALALTAAALLARAAVMEDENAGS